MMWTTLTLDRQILLYRRETGILLSHLFEGVQLYCSIVTFVLKILWAVSARIWPVPFKRRIAHQQSVTCRGGGVGGAPGINLSSISKVPLQFKKKRAIKNIQLVIEIKELVMASIKIDPGIHRPLHVTASNRKHVLIVYFPVFSLSPALDATYNQLASPSPSLKENGNYSTNHYYYVLRHTYFQRKKNGN